LQKLTPIVLCKNANPMSEVEIFDRLKAFVIKQVAVEEEEVTKGAV
jgi:hypothetical protein